MYYDSHIHSTHSADGTSPLEEYTAAVHAAGFPG